MKKLAAVLLMMGLIGSIPTSACDSGYPNGIPKGAITVYVQSVTYGYRIAGTPAEALEAIRSYVPLQLTEDAKNGNTYSRVNDAAEANLIIRVAVNQSIDGKYQADYAVYGLGKTGDGHTLFTAFGEPRLTPLEAFDVTGTLTTQFLENGWTCNTK